MSKNTCIKPVAAVVGAALVGSLSAFNLASAAENPFGTTQLESGYMQLAEAEGKCGEGKCGGDKAAKEGKCGEGKCGGDKGAKEGKCGEG
ncbi:MAG: low-complexity protein, partial [Pseudomonadota bacterium]|nr:low-complexity protein [Pseudomonadota bacterium]